MANYTNNVMTVQLLSKGPASASILPHLTKDSSLFEVWQLIAENYIIWQEDFVGSQQCNCTMLSHVPVKPDTGTGPVLLT